jgi:hypothetical protein
MASNSEKTPSVSPEWPYDNRTGANPSQVEFYVTPAQLQVAGLNIENECLDSSDSFHRGSAGDGAESFFEESTFDSNEFLNDDFGFGDQQIPSLPRHLQIDLPAGEDVSIPGTPSISIMAVILSIFWLNFAGASRTRAVSLPWDTTSDFAISPFKSRNIDGIVSEPDLDNTFKIPAIPNQVGLSSPKVGQCRSHRPRSTELNGY